MSAVFNFCEVGGYGLLYLFIKSRLVCFEFLSKLSYLLKDAYCEIFIKKTLYCCDDELCFLL